VTSPTSTSSDRSSGPLPGKETTPGRSHQTPGPCHLTDPATSKNASRLRTYRAAAGDLPIISDPTAFPGHEILVGIPIEAAGPTPPRTSPYSQPFTTLNSLCSTGAEVNVSGDKKFKQIKINTISRETQAAHLTAFASHEGRTDDLEARLNLNSTNSSKPALDRVAGREGHGVAARPSGWKRGGQPGHNRTLVRLEQLRAFGGSALTENIAVPKDRPMGLVSMDFPITCVQSRIRVILSLSLAWAGSLEAYDIFTDVNCVDYNGYPDRRPECLEAFGMLAILVTRDRVEGRGRFRIHAAPEADKGAEIERGVASGVDYSLTHLLRLDRGRSVL
jgi:hypothetical protein